MRAICAALLSASHTKKHERQHTSRHERQVSGTEREQTCSQSNSPRTSLAHVSFVENDATEAVAREEVPRARQGLAGRHVLLGVERAPAGYHERIAAALQRAQVDLCVWQTRKRCTTASAPTQDPNNSMQQTLLWLPVLADSVQLAVAIEVHALNCNTQILCMSSGSCTANTSDTFGGVLLGQIVNPLRADATP